MMPQLTTSIAYTALAPNRFKVFGRNFSRSPARAQIVCVAS